MPLYNLTNQISALQIEVYGNDFPPIRNDTPDEPPRSIFHTLKAAHVEQRLSKSPQTRIIDFREVWRVHRAAYKCLWEWAISNGDSANGETRESIYKGVSLCTLEMAMGMCPDEDCPADHALLNDSFTLALFAYTTCLAKWSRMARGRREMDNDSGDDTPLFHRICKDHLYRAFAQGQIHTPCDPQKKCMLGGEVLTRTQQGIDPTEEGQPPIHSMWLMEQMMLALFHNLSEPEQIQHASSMCGLGFEVGEIEGCTTWATEEAWTGVQ